MAIHHSAMKILSDDNDFFRKSPELASNVADVFGVAKNKAISHVEICQKKAQESTKKFSSLNSLPSSSDNAQTENNTNTKKE
jgi:hypothetical protein